MRCVNKLFIAIWAYSFFLLPHASGDAPPRDFGPLQLPLAANPLYLRCASSDQQISQRSLMVPGADQRRELLLEVKDKEMLSTGDSCVLSEVSQEEPVGSSEPQHYTTTSPRLYAPESRPLLARTEPNPPPFRIVFPRMGSYRAIYDGQQGTLSILLKESPTRGEVSWVRSGDLWIDAEERLFLGSNYPANSLERLDPVSGRSLWQYRTKTPLSYQRDCNDGDLVAALDHSKLVALDASSGQVRWQFALKDRPSDAAASLLICTAEKDRIYLIHGTQHSRLTALAKASGEVLWTYSGAPNLNVQGREDEVLYVNSFSDEQSRLTGLDASSGRALWQLNLGSTWFSFAPEGALYRLEEQAVVRVSAATGGDLWRVETDAAWFYLSFEKGYTILTEPARLLRLDPEGGEILWNWDLQSFFGQPSHAQLFKTGEILVQAGEMEDRRSLLIDGETGEALWESKQLAPTPGYFTQAQAGDTFAVHGASLQAIDRRTGEARWTFQLPQAEQLIVGSIWREDQAIFTSYAGADSLETRGVLALDAASGQVLWQNYQGAPLSLVGTLDGMLLINTGAAGGSAKAIRY